MMNNKLIRATVLLFCLQTACAVSDDPRQGGLLGYWHGTSSGRYEERQQEKLQQIEKQKRTQQQLSLQRESLKGEYAVENQKLAHQQQSIVAIEEELNDLNAKLDSLKIKSQAQQQQVNSLRDNIQKTRAGIEKQKNAIAGLDAKGGNVDQRAVMILQHERDRLADEYRKLNKYYQALSDTMY